MPAVPSLPLNQDALLKMEATFDERLNQHLAALRRLLLEERKTFVLQVLTACKHDDHTVKREVEADEQVEHHSQDAVASLEDVHVEVASAERITSALSNAAVLPAIRAQRSIAADMQANWAMKKIGRKWTDLRSLVSSGVLLQFFMDLIVMSNIVILGVQAGSTWKGWIIVDCAYAFFYTMEVVIKLSTQGLHLLSPRNPDFKWTAFDIVLAFLAIFDVVGAYISQGGNGENNYSFLRVARLVRMARMLRLLQLDIFKDLLLMINGAVGGLRTLGWSIVMITVPIYTFALFYTEMVGLQAKEMKDDVAPHFKSVAMSMFTGFHCLVVGDCSSVTGTPIFPHLVEQYGWAYGVVYALTSLCMTFGLFNVIVAIYVENTVTAAKSNEMLQRERRLEDQSRFAEKILNLVHFIWTRLHRNSVVEFVLDEALTLEVPEEIFCSLIARPEMHKLLDDLDVPREDHKDIFEICDADGSGIVTITELVAGVRKLRGEPRRSDLVYVMLRINQLLAEVHELQEQITAETDRLKPNIAGAAEPRIMTGTQVHDLKQKTAVEPEPHVAGKAIPQISDPSNTKTGSGFSL